MFNIRYELYFNLKWTLQLVNDISNNLQKLMTALLTASSAFPTRAALYLNDCQLSTVKSLLLGGTSSLLNYHKLPDVSG